MKCGYVAVLGKPNAGKSSLVNFLVGEEVAVVSHRQQTTRNMILGIKNGKDYQIIFLDTPGIHHSKNFLDKYMMKNVRSALASADVVLYLFDGTKNLDDEEKEYIEMLKKKTDKLLLVQTKTDKKQEKFDFDTIKISVKNGENIDLLTKRIVDLLPQNEPIFEDDLYTDKSVSFLIGEKTRGLLLDKLDNEIPHGVAVEVESFIEKEDIVDLRINIFCEQERHKGIVIGKGGKTLKEIGQKVRKYAEDLLQKKCFVELFVKVDKDWRNKNIGRYYH